MLAPSLPGTYLFWRLIWSNPLHTSIKCAVCLITSNFANKSGSAVDAFDETHIIKLTARFS